HAKGQAGVKNRAMGRIEVFSCLIMIGWCHLQDQLCCESSSAFKRSIIDDFLNAFSVSLFTISNETKRKLQSIFMACAIFGNEPFADKDTMDLPSKMQQ
ncbi:MAG TPA: hypothetical protein VFL47_09730, partial [Flavisolibacter sp.]|nr:hypothetical protein [Flavisolibacter sp.]